MKKITSLVAAAALTAGLMSGFTVNAENPHNVPDTESQNVYGLRGEVTDVYSVDIYWGNLTYEYSGGTWNPSTHAYGDEGEWAIETDGDPQETSCAMTYTNDDICIVNHSNAPVNSTIAYATTDGDTGVSGTFSDITTQGGASGSAASGTLPTAEGTATTGAPALKTTLSLGGAPTKALSDTNTKVGEVTVTLSAGLRV